MIVCVYVFESVEGEDAERLECVAGTAHVEVAIARRKAGASYALAFLAGPGDEGGAELVDGVHVGDGDGSGAEFIGGIVAAHHIIFSDEFPMFAAEDDGACGLQGADFIEVIGVCVADIISIGSHVACIGKAGVGVAAILAPGVIESEQGLGF